MKPNLIILILILVISGCGKQKTAKEQAWEHYAKAYSNPSSITFRPPWLHSQGRMDAWRIRELEKAVSLDPRNADYHYSLAEAYEKTSPRSKQEYDAAARLSRRYYAAKCYQESGINSISVPMPVKRTKYYLLKAQKADPGNALIDYELAYCYAKAGDREKAWKLVREGNRKPEVRQYLDPALTNPHLRQSIGMSAAILFPEFASMRELTRQLCYSDYKRYDLRAGKSVSPPQKDSHPYQSLAERFYNSGQYEKTDAVCRDMMMMGRRVSHLGPNETLIAMLVGRAIYAIAQQTNAGFLIAQGKTEAVKAIQAKYDADKKELTPIFNGFQKSSWNTNSMHFRMADLLTGGAFSGVGSQSKIVLWAFWLMIPAITLIPILVAIVLLIRGLLKRLQEGHLKGPEAISVVFLLLAVILFGWLASLFYSGWNPVAVWAENKLYQDWVLVEKRTVRQIIAVMDHTDRMK